MKRLRRFMRRLRCARSGVAAVEFALTMPFLMVAGLYGAETSWYVLVNMQVSQIAVQVADNASRVGDTSYLQDRRIYEADLNDLLLGANLNGGSMLKILQNGRIIISSLEVGPGTATTQYIHWQRCKGLKNYTSSYGVAGASGLTGMGPAGHQVSTIPGEAVIFVEVAYDYQPLISSSFIRNRTITATASFYVRDDRDLTQIYQINTASPDPVASCSTFSSS